jgi:hypothetical protein
VIVVFFLESAKHSVVFKNPIPPLKIQLLLYASREQHGHVAKCPGLLAMLMVDGNVVVSVNGGVRLLQQSVVVPTLDRLK